MGSRRRADPWEADSLEWATTSPPPEYNFAAHAGGEQPSSAVGRAATAPGRGAGHRSGDGVRWVSKARSRRRCRSPRGSTRCRRRRSGSREPTYLPFVVAVGIAFFFVGLLVEAAIVGVVGIVVGGVAIMRWTWRTEEDLR